MDIETNLRDIAKLVNDHGAQDWGRVFSRLADEYPGAPEETKRKIRRLYGGMGSFNDLVLHTPDGVPLVAENNALDRLSTELYEILKMRS